MASPAAREQRSRALRPLHETGPGQRDVSAVLVAGRARAGAVGWAGNAGEEVQDLLVGGAGDVGDVSVTGVREHHEPGSGDAAGESLSVGGGDDAVPGSVHDQRRDADLP